jgi:hypothetical protein
MMTMKDWRTQWRKRLFGFTLSAVVGENPLEVGMIAWGAFAGLNAALGEPPSNALKALPFVLQAVWAAMMFIAGLIVAGGLKAQRDRIVASGMYLFASTMAVYALTVITTSGYAKGGAVASFLLIISVVCFIRGWWLKEVEAAQIRWIVRNRNRDR